MELFIEYWKKEHEVKLQGKSPEDLAKLVESHRDYVMKSHAPMHIPEKGTLMSVNGEEMIYTVTSVDTERRMLSAELDIGGQLAPAEITLGEGKFQVWCQCEECPADILRGAGGLVAVGFPVSPDHPHSGDDRSTIPF